jgi:hypothetical protein
MRIAPRAGVVRTKAAPAAALVFVLCVGCSETAGHKVFGADAAADASEEQIVPPYDARHFDAPSDPADDGKCTTGEEPRPCAAIFTGCPSMSECSERFGRMCPCRSCKVALEAGLCAWEVMADYPDATWVDRVQPDGGSRRLDRVEPGPCRADQSGFVVTWVPGMTTVTLCPATCREHEADRTIGFALDRGPCPPS